MARSRRVGLAAIAVFAAVAPGLTASAEANAGAAAVSCKQAAQTIEAGKSSGPYPAWPTASRRRSSAGRALWF